MKTSFLIITIYFSFTFVAVSQTWPKIYINPAGYSSGKVASETYDNGIIILADNLGPFGLRNSGWLIKTDINGNLLWERLIGNPELYLSMIDNMSVTSDSGLIVAMSSNYAELYPFGEYPDPIYLKINSCGFVDWCNIVSTLGLQNSSYDAIQAFDSYYGLYFNWNTANNHIGLVKMDLQGNIQWMFTYNNELIVQDYAYDILSLPDSTILLTGLGNYYSETLSSWMTKPLKLHINKDGALINWQILQQDNDSIDGEDFYSIRAANGTIYSSGNTITSQTYPYNFIKSSLRKHSVDNPGIEFFTLRDTVSSANNLAWMQDSTIVLTSATEVPTNVWFEIWAEVSIIDTLGNVLRHRRLLDNYTGPQFHVSTTSENKILATASAEENPYGPMLNTMLFKLTSTLEDDVFDPTPRVYDYACPGGVAPHDTIGMEECDIVVSAEHLATLPDVAVIEVYPNPVKDQFHVRLPEFIAIRNSNKGLRTALYQSNYQQQSTLQVFNLSGRFITEQKLLQGQLIAEFDASNWAPGMYLLRLVYKDKTVGSAKVVK